MSIKLVSTHPGFKGVSVEKGIAEALSGSEPTYIAVCNYLFNSIDAFWEATEPHGTTLQDDMLNCTNIRPVIQFSEVLIDQ
jgi:uncharacterized protein (TIGR02118 family)